MQTFAKAVLIAAVFATLVVGTEPAYAALQAVGPTNAVTTIPEWYQDTNGLTLGPCLDQNNFCVLTPLFDPLVTNPPNPITTTGPIDDTNFPDELFYFLADSGPMTVGPTGAGKATLRLALEAFFAPLGPGLPAVAPGNGGTFLRINLKKMLGLTPNSTYTVTHPYGTFQFFTDVDGTTTNGGAGQAFRTEDPFAGAIPGIFFPLELQNATNTHIGPFLVATGGLITDPVTGSKYIGNPGSPTTVTGSPTGNNFFRIDGPDIGGPGINTIETNLFALAGKIVGLQVAPPAGGNDFGAWQPGSTVPAKTYTVTNLTGPSSTVSPLLNSNPTAFSILNDTCSNAILTAVAPGNTCTFDVVFTPVAEGAATGTVTINTTTGTASVTATGSGDATPPTVTVAAPAFTNQSNLTISGTVADNIAVGAVQVSLNGGAPAAATVTAGTWSFNVVGLTANAANNISVTASDTTQPAANVSLAQNATVTHDSINPLVGITSPVGVEGVATPVLTFSATDTNGIVSTIVTLDSVVLPSVPATLGPLTNGSHSVKVDVTDSAGNIGTDSSSFSVNHGPAMGVSPASALFSNVGLNITSSPKAFTITNNGNSGLPLSVTSIAFSGIDPTMFKLGNGSCGTLPANVPIGGSCNFEVSFAPNATGTKLADLTVSVSAVDEPPVVLALEGICVSTTNSTVRSSLPTLTNYPSLLDAFTAATGNATLQAMDTVLPANGSVPAVVVVDSTGIVNFNGGYDAIYAAKTGVTEMLGAMLVRRGTLVVDRLTIQ